MDAAGRRLAVLLDEQPLWLDAMAELLARMDVEAVGRATRPTQALELVREHKPDVFIASMRAADRELDGLSCVRLVGEELPAVKLVVLSQSSDSKHIDAAIAAGADVYCLKTAHPDDLAAAIRQSFETSIYFLDTSRNQAERAKKRVAVPRTHAKAAATAERESRGAELTERELELLRLMADGYSNSQLARMLYLSEQTVKFHLSNIYRKLEVSNRTEAARWAQLNDLLLPSSTADVLDGVAELPTAGGPTAIDIQATNGSGAVGLATLSRSLLRAHRRERDPNGLDYSVMVGGGRVRQLRASPRGCNRRQTRPSACSCRAAGHIGSRSRGLTSRHPRDRTIGTG